MIATGYPAHKPEWPTREALSYHCRRPDPYPSVFGYHEIFHAYVCAAATCQFAAIARHLRCSSRHSPCLPRRRRPTWSAPGRRLWRGPLGTACPTQGHMKRGSVRQTSARYRYRARVPCGLQPSQLGGRCCRNRPGPLIRGARPTARLNSRWRCHTKSIPNAGGIQPNRKNAGSRMMLRGNTASPAIATTARCTEVCGWARGW